MKTTITYLFDPLCGWCYGAAPAIGKLSEQSDITLVLAPSGLFSDSGGRVLDAAFAGYAWSNDQRIEKLTGQRFTPEYRSHILSKPGSRFDSAAATMALSAVAMSAPERELDALRLLQEARYLYAQDTCDWSVVTTVLRNNNFNRAADNLTSPDDALRDRHRKRIRNAQEMMHSFGVQGVPALIISDGQGSRLLRSNALYTSFDTLLSDIAAV